MEEPCWRGAGRKAVIASRCEDGRDFPTEKQDIEDSAFSPRVEDRGIVQERISHDEGRAQRPRYDTGRPHHRLSAHPPGFTAEQAQEDPARILQKIPQQNEAGIRSCPHYEERPRRGGLLSRRLEGLLGIDQRRGDSYMRILIIGMIQFYRNYLSIFKLQCCRYYPSCSEYAIEALRKHGVVIGLSLAFTRLFRCHPFSRGGYDPVK